MPRLNGKVPRYRLHKPSGQAIVTLNHRDYYLGIYGSPESKQQYDRLVAEWLAYGRQTPVPVPAQPQVTVDRVIWDFWEHAKTYYRKADGTPTSEISIYHTVLHLLRQMYGPTSAIEFGPRALAAVRQRMIEKGWGRKSINRNIGRIAAIFKHAASLEKLPVSVYQQLKTLAPLKRGRTAARETTRVRPVPEPMIDAIQSYVSRQVWAVICLQRLGAGREGELLGLRGIDLKDTDKDVWTAQLQEHKTAHHGIEKTLYFGPQAQQILKQFMVERPIDAYLFNPTEAEAERREKLHSRRKVKLPYGNRPGTNRVAHPKRQAGQRYTVAAYRRAIQRGCDEAFLPPPELSRVKIPGAHGNGHTNGGVMTASQRRAILAIARRMNVDPEYEAKQIVGDNLDDLSLKQASELIDHLKGLQPAGNGRGR